MILKALERAGQGLTPEDLFVRIRSGSAQYWEAPDAQIVTETEPGNVHIWLAGGKLGPVLSLYEQVEAWARRIGAEDITIDGRSGWRRVLRPYGYTPDGPLLRKVLNEKQDHH